MTSYMILWRHEREVRKIKQMTVRLEDEFYKEVKYALIEKEKSFNEYVVELIKKDLKESKK